MVNCWWFFHTWGKWEVVEVEVEMLLTHKRTCLKQQRKCEKCGLVQLKSIL